MRDNYRVTYHVDLVFCIDTTGSMRPIIDLVKRKALELYNDISTYMSDSGKIIDKMRIRVISFRDYIADKEAAMSGSPFFHIPEENHQFEECVNLLTAEGGGDVPEDGLEAIAFAIKSPWTTEGTRKRHVIVVWSDAPTHELGYARKSEYYPKESMPKSFTDLTLWWGDAQTPGLMDQSAKRLLMFAPDDDWWTKLADYWDNIIHVTAEPGKGLGEMDYQAVIAAICKTI